MLQTIILWQLYLQLAMITPRHHCKHVGMWTLVLMTNKWSNDILHIAATQPMAKTGTTWKINSLQDVWAVMPKKTNT